MTATASPTKLGYWINDADNHFNEPPDCFERYIDPKDSALAIRSVTDPDGQPIGKIRIEFSRRHYTLLDSDGQVAGRAVGDLGASKFAVTGADGERFAQIRKTWAGLGKELLTSSDHYTVTFTGPVSPDLRTMIVMVPIVLDMTRHGPY